MPEQAHMVEQIIKYSDGTETSIKYRGVIIDGVLQSEEVKEGVEESAPAEAEAPVEAAPAEEAPVAPSEEAVV